MCGKRATTLDEQIDILRKRGVIIEDEIKAKENLLDIGYFRLGSYLFPFEESFPELENRNHKFVEGTRFDDAVTLYYLDYDLRLLLYKYISRVEVAFRTYVTYKLSNEFIESPTWFVDSRYVKDRFVTSFSEKIYSDIKTKSVIKHHHKKHVHDLYAPAWKTLEYMTFGQMLSLYENLKDVKYQLMICNHFGVKRPRTFINYVETLRVVRNICAHGGILYDLKLARRVIDGPAGKFSQNDSYKLISAVKILEFLLGRVSVNRVADLKLSLANALTVAVKRNISLKGRIVEITGIDDSYFK